MRKRVRIDASSCGCFKAAVDPRFKQACQHCELADVGSRSRRKLKEDHYLVKKPGANNYLIPSLEHTVMYLELS